MPIKNKKRKVCFIITSFIHYSRSLFILEELKKRKDIELHIIIGGTALLDKYSSKFAHVKNILIKEGYKNLYELYFNLEGDESVVKTKTIGLGIIEFATMYNKINPDIIVIRGDRFEVLSAAVAATNMNIPIAHIEGGDVSGTIDESVRHAITKLSHIHFTTNKPAKKRVLQMGEDKKYVFNFGSPEIEIVQRISKGNHHVDLGKTGSGASFNAKDDYLMVMYHPVTTEVEKIKEYVKILLKAIYELNMPTLWFWPNFDAGAEEISQELRVFKDYVDDHKIRFMRYLPPKDFIWLLDNSKVLIGNSSAGVKESSFMGIPVVDIGSRQNRRLKAGNVLQVDHNTKKIKDAIAVQLKKGRYPKSKLYEGNEPAKRIAEKIATSKLYIQKSFKS